MAASICIIIGCGGTPLRPIPPYVVLTSIRSNDPADEEVRALAKWRDAKIIRFEDWQKERPDLIASLRKVHPMFVLWIVPHSTITPEFSRFAFELARGIDSDPFVDFYYGVLPWTDSESLRSYLGMAKGQQAKSNRTLYRLLEIERGPKRGVSETRLEWASGLPRTVITLEDSEGALKHNELIEDADFLILHTAIDPMALELDGMVVFCDTPYNAGDLIGEGAIAAILPLKVLTPVVAGAEMEHILITDAPIGEAVKNTYDTISLHRGTAKLSLTEEPDLLASRWLYGDPMLHHLRRDARSPWKREAETEEVDNKQGVAKIIRLRITDDPPRLLTHPWSEGMRLHVRFELPSGTRAARGELVSCQIRGKKVDAQVSASALEVWDRKPYLHIAVDAKSLKAGTEIELRIRRTD